MSYEKKTSLNNLRGGFAHDCTTVFFVHVSNVFQWCYKSMSFNRPCILKSPWDIPEPMTLHLLGCVLEPIRGIRLEVKVLLPSFSDHFKRELISVLDPFLRNKAEVAISRRDVIEDYLMKLISILTILNMKLYLNLIQRILSIGWTHPLLYNTITVRRSATWPPCTFCCCYLWFSVVPIAAVHPAKDPPHLIDPGFFKAAFTRRSAQNRLMFS